MSVDQAQALVRRAIDDPDFLARLHGASHEDKRAILDEAGFGDVTLAHLSQAVPASNGGELTDEEFAAVAGAGATSTIASATASAAAAIAAAPAAL